MLIPDPTLKRQLPDDGPMLLWRDRQGGGREALALLTTKGCVDPDCPCRTIVVRGWLVRDYVAEISGDDRALRCVTKSGAKREQSHEALLAAIDVDDGSFGKIVGAPPSAPWAMEWLRGELDAELLEKLRQRFEAVKATPPKPPAPRDWRKADWSWWEPGKDVGWIEIASDGYDAGELRLDQANYVVGDCYCVEPGCPCEVVRVIFWLESDPDPDAELEAIGDVTVDPAFPEGAQLNAHGPKHALLKRLWAAWTQQHDVPALLLRRRNEMRALAPEIHERFGSREKQRAMRSVGPNDRCPCGSGKKYKRCCMSEARS